MFVLGYPALWLALVIGGDSFLRMAGWLWLEFPHWLSVVVLVHDGWWFFTIG
jgi:hypothetical protein